MGWKEIVKRRGGGKKKRRRKRKKEEGDRKSREKEREGDAMYKTPGKYTGGRKRECISREYVCKTYTLLR